MSWFRRVTVRIDGEDVGQLEPGESGQWAVDAGGHVVRVYDPWGRSQDCQVAVAPRRRTQRGPTELHCQVNAWRTATVKTLAPLWFVAQFLPGFAWSLRTPVPVSALPISGD